MSAAAVAASHGSSGSGSGRFAPRLTASVRPRGLARAWLVSMTLIAIALTSRPWRRNCGGRILSRRRVFRPTGMTPSTVRSWWGSSWLLRRRLRWRPPRPSRLSSTFTQRRLACPGICSRHGVMRSASSSARCRSRRLRDPQSLCHRQLAPTRSSWPGRPLQVQWMGSSSAWGSRVLATTAIGWPVLVAPRRV